MTDYLAAVTEILGPAQNRHADPVAWDCLHAELGIQLPPDYRSLWTRSLPLRPAPSTGIDHLKILDETHTANTARSSNYSPLLDDLWGRQ